MERDGAVPTSPPARAWETERAFRNADARRGLPVEIEFGARWFGAEDDDPWQVRWLGATGELVAIQLDGGPVRLLAHAVARVDVEAALRGWWQVCGHRGSLPWVERRAATIATGGSPPVRLA